MPNMAREANGTLGAVSAGDPRAALFAMGAFASGGNAIDAAVHAALCQWVVMPDMCGPGGDLFALVGEGESVKSVNGCGPAPAAWASGSRCGPGAATVPAALQGLEALHAMGALLPLTDAFGKAAELADRGFVLSDGLVRQCHTTAGMGLLAQLEHAWGASPITPGTFVRWPVMAKSLRELADRGIAGFVESSISARMTREWCELGAEISQSDLQQVSCDGGAPVTLKIDGWAMSVNPPVSQGVLLLTAMGSLDVDLRTHLASAQPGGVHAAIEAAKYAFAEAPRIHDGNGNSALDLVSRQELIGIRRALTPFASNGPMVRVGYGETTHLACTDNSGRVVSLIHSLYRPFGSTALSPSTGFILNNRGECFDSGDNSPAAGRRPRTTLTNVVARRTDGTCLALGTPGANAQVQTNLQVLNSLMARASTDWAGVLDQPRWSLWGGDHVAVEDGFDRKLLLDLGERGHKLVTRPQQDWVAGAVGVVASFGDGQLLSLHDGRRGGQALAL